MIEQTPYQVVVLPITTDHKEVFSRVENRVISQQELLCAGVEYWLHNVRLRGSSEGTVCDESDIWDAVNEALWALEDWELQTLAALHQMRVSQAVSTECDQLSHEVMQIGEDLSDLLSTIGSVAEEITNICRIDWDDCAAYVYCYFERRTT